MEAFRSASSRYRCLMEGSLSERWVISTHFGHFFLHIFLLQSTEQTSIDIEFTECLNTSFAKSPTGEKMKAGGVSAQKTTESENLGCNHSKSQEKKKEGDANNNNNEENLKKWKTNLDAACQGEKLSPGSGGHLDGWRRLSGCGGGQFNYLSLVNFFSGQVVTRRDYLGGAKGLRRGSFRSDTGPTRGIHH